MKLPRRRDANRSPGRAGLPRRAPAKPPAEAGARPGRRKTSFTGRAAVLAVVLAALAIALAGPLRQFISQRSQISSLRGDVNAQTEQLKKLQEQQKQWSSPAYVQQQARDRLHYVMPGEVPYVTLSPTPSASAGAATAKPAADQPWYAQLWSSVQGASVTARATPSASSAPSAGPSPTPAP